MKNQRKLLGILIVSLFIAAPLSHAFAQIADPKTPFSSVAEEHPFIDATGDKEPAPSFDDARGQSPKDPFEDARGSKVPESPYDDARSNGKSPKSPFSDAGKEGHMFMLGDLNDDHVVDTTDWLILHNHWGACPQNMPCPTFGDFNHDRMINETDLAILYVSWFLKPFNIDGLLDRCLNLDNEYAHQSCELRLGYQND